MFEKEAEEYTGKVHRYRDNLKELLQDEDVFNAFKDGANYGYNKANEWHYVKDGDLPKDDENFICMLENGYKLECYYDPTTKRWYDNYFHHDTEYGYYQSKVIAWKEIVLPKE